MSRWSAGLAVVALAVSVAAMLAFFRYSRFGIAMRAVASDDATARLMGVRTARVQQAAWGATEVDAYVEHRARAKGGDHDGTGGGQRYDPGPSFCS